jgi:DNA-binding response OmpR family regulator
MRRPARISSRNSVRAVLGKVSAWPEYGNYKAMQLTRESSQFLIIDDDPNLTRFLVTYLRHKGHSCQALTEGFQTAAWLAHHDCEVVVVDLKMPKVDGISLISFIREISPRVPIVVFTGLGYDEEQMQAALRAGANGYVSKNLPVEQLYCVLSRLLATCQQRAHRETANRSAVIV